MGDSPKENEVQIRSVADKRTKEYRKSVGPKTDNESIIQVKTVDRFSVKTSENGTKSRGIPQQTKKTTKKSLSNLSPELGNAEKSKAVSPKKDKRTKHFKSLPNSERKSLIEVQAVSQFSVKASEKDKKSKGRFEKNAELSEVTEKEPDTSTETRKRRRTRSTSKTNDESAESSANDSEIVAAELSPDGLRKSPRKKTPRIPVVNLCGSADFDSSIEEI